MVGISLTLWVQGDLNLLGLILPKNIPLIGLIFAAPSPFKDTSTKKKVTFLEFQDSLFKKKLD